MGKNSKKVFTFGEIMLRITPTFEGERIIQASNFTVSPGGSEVNVAIALSLLGTKCGFITKLPDNILAEKIIQFLQKFSVDTSYIAYGGNRLGLYWTETGKNVRPFQVIYDREGSSFSTMSYSNLDWNLIFRNTSWFHVSGITPAVSKKAYGIVHKAINTLPKDIKLSVDLNYRSKLWKWANGERVSIHEAMKDVCANAYLITGNEIDFFDSLGIGTGKEYSPEAYKKIASKCFKIFPRLNYIGISLRKSTSASENFWSGILFTKRKGKIVTYKGPEFKITDIVDRIGTGDSFSAAIIYGLNNREKDLQHIVDFAVGLSALNHTVRGDASQFRVSDVEHLLNNKGSRIVR